MAAFLLRCWPAGLWPRPPGACSTGAGGRAVMTGGSFMATLGCLLVAWSPNPAIYAIAWIVMGLSIPLVL